MKEALLLVFANKQDIPGSMTPQEVTERLRLGQLKERTWYVVPSCATTGEGLLEGLVSQLVRVRIDTSRMLTVCRAG